MVSGFSIISKIESLMCKPINCLEIVLNSLSSVLSYNNFDFEPIFARKDKKSKARKKVKHEPTVVKQTIYFLIMTSLNLG